MRTSTPQTIDQIYSPINRADLLAREMEDAALRYARMTEQLDSVLRAERLRRRDAWTHSRRRSEPPTRPLGPSSM